MTSSVLSDIAASTRLWSTVKALVVGDVMLDRTVTGTVHRCSPEAPVPVLTRPTTVDSLGGAANVARQLAALGVKVTLVGVVGDDEEGHVLRRLCDDAGIADGLVNVADRPTTCKTRFLSGSHHLLRLDREIDLPSTADVEKAVGDQLAASAPVDVVVLSDYAKGAVTARVAADTLATARAWGAPVLVDPKRSDPSLYAGVDIIKANHREMEALIGVDLGDDPVEGAIRQGPALMAATSCSALVVTLGREGMVVMERGREAVVLPAATVDVVDVTGAGDTVIAVLALGAALGLGPAPSAELANCAAAVVVTRSGVEVVSRDDLLAVVECDESAGPSTWEDLAGLLAAWRAADRRIVLTNGCFDLLHAGHLELLRRAAALGDKLVVAVDSDRSVRSLKGGGRPVVPEAERCALLAAIHWVDATVIFDGHDLENLVRLVRPDVLVKGEDHAAVSIVGGDLVEAAGGSVVRVPLVAGISTTARIASISYRERQAAPRLDVEDD